MNKPYTVLFEFNDLLLVASDDHNDLGGWNKDIFDALTALKEARFISDRARNMLAVFNRDGGHLQEEIGFDKACDAAEAEYYSLRAKEEELALLQEENAELTKELLKYQSEAIDRGIAKCNED